MATHENATVADLQGGGFVLLLSKIKSGAFAGGGGKKGDFSDLIGRVNHLTKTRYKY